MPGMNSRHWDTIIDALTPGDIVDPSGLATEKLRAITGHESTNALTKVLSRMEQAGVIERDISGRRTSRIGLTAEAREESLASRGVPVEAETAPEPSLDGDGVDYDMLANVLLAKALKATQAQESSAAVKELEERVARAEAARRIAEADARAAREKAAELEAAVRQMDANIKAMMAQADRPKGRGTFKVGDDPKLQRELDKLIRMLPSAKR